MGIHSDAVELAQKSGKTLAECKKIRKAKSAEFGAALRESSGADRIDVLMGVCFGKKAPAAKAPAPPAPKAAEKPKAPAKPKEAPKPKASKPIEKKSKKAGGLASLLGSKKEMVTNDEEKMGDLKDEAV